MNKSKIIMTLLIISLLLTVSILAANASKISKRTEQKTRSTKVGKKTKIKHQTSNLKPIKRGESIPQRPTEKVKRKKYNKVENKTYSATRIKKKYYKHFHKPYEKVRIHKKHYHSPLKYHYTIDPRFIYRGLWIRISINHPNGYYFYNNYPYFVYNGFLHRYSSSDPGSYDLVDKRTREVYATFYGNSLRQSYDRCAELRDRLNNKLGEYRYFCAERFEYDPDYSYDWNPHDYPNWYWK